MIKPFVRDSKYIPRKTYTARKVFLNKDNTSIFENAPDSTTPETYESFLTKACTIQPTTGQDLQTLSEGLRDKESYKILTSTPLTAVIENTNRLGDQIQYDGVNGTSWFTVVKVKKWDVGVCPHYEAVIVKEPTD